MNTRLRYAVLLLLLASVAGHADFDEGVRAYERGEYDRAYALWHPLAEAGDPAAQQALGWLNLRGLGRPQSDAVALRWYQEAARRGRASAQNALGELYANGQGTARDDVEAHAWFVLAERGGEAAATVNRQTLEGRMSADQRARAVARLRELERQLAPLQNSSPFPAPAPSMANSPPMDLVSEATGARTTVARAPQPARLRFSRPETERRDLYLDLGRCIRDSGREVPAQSIVVAETWIAMSEPPAPGADGDPRERVVACMREAGYQVERQ